MKKTIQFKVETQWGNRREFVVNQNDARIILQLTGKKTIDSMTRNLISELTAGAVNFEQVLN